MNTIAFYWIAGCCICIVLTAIWCYFKLRKPKYVGMKESDFEQIIKDVKNNIPNYEAFDEYAHTQPKLDYFEEAFSKN